MTNKEVRTTYVAQLDQQSYNRVSRELKKQSDEQLKATKAIASASDKQSDAIKAQVKAQKELQTQSERAIRAEKSRLDLLDKQNSAIRNQVGSIGDVDSALSAIRGGLGAITGTNIAGLEQAAGLFELTEATAQLRGAAPAAGEAIGKLASSIGVTGFGLGAVALVAVGAVAAFARVISDDLTKAVEQGLRSIRANIEAEQTAIDDIASGATRSDIFQKRTELLRDLDSTGQKLGLINNDLLTITNSTLGERLISQLSGVTDTLQGEFDSLSETYAGQIELLKEYDALLADTTLIQNEAAQGALDRVDSLQNQYDIEQRVNQFSKTATSESLNARLEAIQTEKDLIQSQISELNEFSSANTELGQQARDTIAELESKFNDLDTESTLLNGTIGETIIQREQERNALQSVNDKLKEQTEINKQREASLGRLTALESQSNKLLEDFNRQQSEILQERQLRDLRETEDYNREIEQKNKDHQQELADIQRDGNDAITNINQNLDSLRSEFFNNEIEATQQYRKNLSDLNRQYRIEDKQALDDHLADLRDAEQSNDVISFLQAQRTFEQEQKEKETQRSQEFKELNQQFSEDKRLRQQAFNERQVDLQRELSLTRQQTNEKLTLARQAFAEELRQTDRERQLKLQRQAQDERIADERSRQQLQRQLYEINLKAQAELSAIRQVTTAVSELELVARRIAGNSGSGTSGTLSGLGYSALGTKSYEQNALRNSARLVSVNNDINVRSGQRAFAFANGGIIDRPTLGLIGETGNPEAVIPFNRSRGLKSALADYGIIPRGMSGNAGMVQLNFAPNLTVGDIATGSEVTQALQQFANDLTSQLHVGLTRAINQTG